MSSPNSWAWHEYYLLISAVSKQGHTYTFLVNHMEQVDAMDAIIATFVKVGRVFGGMTVESLQEDTYRLLCENIKPEYILEY